MFSIAINIVPNLIRAFSVVFVYKTISHENGSEGLISFALGGLIASISASLALGCSYNYLLINLRRGVVFGDEAWSITVFLTTVGAMISVGLSILFFLNGSRNYDYFGITGILLISVVSYVGFTISALANSAILGRLDNRTYASYASVGSVLFFISYFISWLLGDYEAMMYCGLLGFPVCSGAVSAFYLLKSGELVNLRICSFRSIRSSAIFGFIVPSIPVIFSSVSLPVFFNGMISAVTSEGNDLAAGLISGFRFTDMIGVFSGAVISAWVFPRICGWGNDVKIKVLLFRSYGYVLLVSAAFFCGVGFFWSFLTELFFTNSAYLPRYLIIIFLAAELLRSSIPVLGYALIDAKMILVYVLVDILFKVVLGLFATNLVSYGGVELLVFTYFVLAVVSSILAFYSILKR